jgi:hypothetical protein
MFNFLKKTKKLDIVLQATGVHSWNVGEGWKNAAKQQNILNRVFKPTSDWGLLEPKNDNGLFKYLKKETPDYILLLGFDWHSQCLHSTDKWKEAWHKNKSTKILYVQESLLNNSRQAGNDDMINAFKSASEFSDLVIYTDILDKQTVEEHSKKSSWFPFGADTSIFKMKIPLEKRKNRLFFRGQTTPYYGEQTYSERRELKGKLLEEGILEVIPYKRGLVKVEDIVAGYNEYIYAINFPSIFAGHPTRVTEAMSCGCVCFTNRTGIEENDDLFKDGENLFYYSGYDNFMDKWNEVNNDIRLCNSVSENAMQAIKQSFSLESQLQKIINLI